VQRTAVRSQRDVFFKRRLAITRPMLRMFATVCCMVAAVTSAQAAPAASIALDPASGCESGRLSVATTGISGGRMYWRASWSDAVSKDVVLGQGEGPGPVDSYGGSIDFPFVTGPVPFGIAVTLYGYQGTPPTPATTAEFALTYV
jgi:hypothetical protein